MVLEPAALARYADAAVVGCLGVAPGDVLMVQAEPAHRELAVALVEAGYRAGAELVDVAYRDRRVGAARIRSAPDDALGVIPDWEVRRLRAQVSPRTAVVSITGEGDPGVFDGLDHARVAAELTRPARRHAWYRRATLDGRIRWSVLAWPTEPWAAQVYPELDADEGRRRLALDLLDFCRLGADDPEGVEGWLAHATRLAGRAAALTELRLAALELRAPGTRLDVRLPEGALFAGGRRENAYGQVVSANMPTEEVFTSPLPAPTAGTFRCTRPLSFRGRMIEGLGGEFRRGRLVRLTADREEDRDFLAAFLDSDRGARRLGEVALVDRSSRIGRAGRTYWNTLLDENAAAHIAFGAGFDFTRDPAAPRSTVNRSAIHVDVMVGSDELEATGVAGDGRRVPLLAGGAWQL